MEKFPLKHVVEAQQFNQELLNLIFSVSDSMRTSLIENKNHYFKNLEHKIMASMFYEPSTRTRFSFESAMIRSGGNILTTENAQKFSSAIKGESLRDSIRVMNAYADIIVMRHNIAGSANEAANVSRVPIINAGDGSGQHPTQALLDIYTIFKHFGEINSLKIAMVGDLKYGRTVRSLCYLLAKYSRIKIFFISPLVCSIGDDITDYLDRHNTFWEKETDIKKVLPEVDCVYMTRIQKERFPDQTQAEEVAGHFILTPELVKTMKKNAIIMHPLPRNKEIPVEIDNDPRAKYFQQAENGLYVRMALLHLLLN